MGSELATSCVREEQQKKCNKFLFLQVGCETVRSFSIISPIFFLQNYVRTAPTLPLLPIEIQFLIQYRKIREPQPKI